MINLYLDCEFNGNKGHFISIALYNPRGESFYEVCKMGVIIRTLTPWVQQNVVPNFNKEPVDWVHIQAKLVSYLSSFEDEITIYADWPEDFKHLSEFLYTIDQNSKVPDKVIRSLTMKMVTTPDTHTSKIPHNALADAEALYLNCLEMYK